MPLTERLLGILKRPCTVAFFAIVQKYSKSPVKKSQTHMSVTIERELNSEHIKREISNAITDKVQLIKSDAERLEEIFKKNPSCAAEYSAFNKVKCLINELENSLLFNGNAKNIDSALDRVSQANNKIKDIIESIKELSKNHNTQVGQDIFERLEKALDYCGNYLDDLKCLLSNIHGLGQLGTLNPQCNRPIIEQWCQKYEALANCVDRSVEAIPEEYLKILLKLSESALNINFPKREESQRRIEATGRIRRSAYFIYHTIDSFKGILFKVVESEDEEDAAIMRGFLQASESSLSEVWSGEEEDEIWKDL